MWPPSEWEMRDALDLATPEQRQQVIQSGGKPAEIANRLNLAENITRTKLQTPPPPQGTVMNQYYQWPQQQQQMGLAQPGLEEMAQQYAAGGLVAFADGGPVYDYDGGNGYAEGGLASMLPMGYAGEDDVPVFNGYAYGGDVLRSVMPYTTGYGEMDDDELDDMIASEIEAETTGAPQVEESYNAGPGDIIGVGLEGLKKVGSGIKALGSGIADKAFIKDPAWEARKDPTERARQEYEALKGPVPDRNKPSEPSFSDKAGRVVDAFAGLLRGNTESGEDRKMQENRDSKTQKAAAQVAEGEKTNKAKKASVPVPSANPVRLASTSAPQTPPAGLEPIPAEEERRRVMDQIRAEGYEEPSQSISPTQVPEQRAIAQQVVNSGLSADQQIAALAKYFQTDTSEAMRIKGEMEKENAHAGNVGIMAVLANALGMGLGTYGTGAARWGAGLMGAAQGFMSEEDRAARRQDEINKLRREIAESPSKKHNEAAKMYFDVLREQGKLRSAEDIARAKAIQQQRLAEYKEEGTESRFGRSEVGKNARTAQMVNAREQAMLDEKMKTAQNLERYYRDSTDYRIASEEERRRRIAEIYAGQGLTPPGAMSSQGMGTRPIITRSGIQSPSAP